MTQFTAILLACLATATTPAATYTWDASGGSPLDDAGTLMVNGSLAADGTVTVATNRQRVAFPFP